MGTLIEAFAKQRGHEISCVIDKDDTSLYQSKEFKESDVAIQFTQPDAAVEGILACFAVGVPVVVGTTGWQDSIPAIQGMCEEGKGTVLYSSNFSIGMNIFMAVNRYLARIMNKFESYDPKVTETHHIHKLDHPSGTAVSLANDIVKIIDRLKGWIEGKNEKGMLPVYYRREGEVPGIHTVTWESGCDIIEITHSAKNREGFAIGAVEAAEWLVGKKGFFTMTDMLRETTGIEGL